MAILTLCILPVILLVVSWAFASLMRTIGILRGWNPKGTFWTSAIAFALFDIAYGVVGAFLIGSFPDYDILISIPYYAILIIGILSPLVNLSLKWFYPDAFKRSPSSLANVNPTYQRVLEKQPLPQPHSSSSLGNIPQDKLESAASPIASGDLSPDAGAGSGHIFISYRRSDSADIAGRIYDRLIGRFGKNPIFKDVDSIPLGLDFKEYLDKKVGECDVLLAIIGDRWLEASDSAGKYRIEDPFDFVRIEIESALGRDIPVIPLLVRGAGMPPEERLPSSLRKLVYRNGIPVRSDPDFHRDMDRLISALEKYIKS